MFEVTPLTNPLTLAAVNGLPAAGNNAVTGVCSLNHFPNRSAASCRDAIMFDLYVCEFGEENARFYAQQHGLESDVSESNKYDPAVRTAQPESESDAQPHLASQPVAKC